MVDTKRLRHDLTKTKLRIPIIWLRHRGFNNNDVFVASYPRSGSTWFRFVLFEILANRLADFDSVNWGIPRPGYHFGAPPLLPGGGRMIQTHEHYRFEYRKAFYLVRDVRDVIISEYYHQKGKGLYVKELDDFFRTFVKGAVNGYGPWERNVKSWLEAKRYRKADIYIVKFEEMREKPEEIIASCLEFLGVCIKPACIQSALANNTIDRMREKEKKAGDTVFRTWNRGVNFVRTGASGGWRQTLSDRQIQLLERTTRTILAELGYEIIER